MTGPIPAGFVSAVAQEVEAKVRETAYHSK